MEVAITLNLIDRSFIIQGLFNNKMYVIGVFLVLLKGFFTSVVFTNTGVKGAFDKNADFLSRHE